MSFPLCGRKVSDGHFLRGPQKSPRCVSPLSADIDLLAYTLERKYVTMMIFFKFYSLHIVKTFND